jgi:hypothetical protein
MSAEAILLPRIDELTIEVKRLGELIARLTERQTVKEFYTTEEFAKLKGIEPRTVRDYCNQGRLEATKKRSGHGRAKAWAISHAESERFDREGLLPGRIRVEQAH